MGVITVQALVNMVWIKILKKENMQEKRCGHGHPSWNEAGLKDGHRRTVGEH